MLAEKLSRLMKLWVRLQCIYDDEVLHRIENVPSMDLINIKCELDIRLQCSMVIKSAEQFSKINAADWSRRCGDNEQCERN